MHLFSLSAFILFFQQTLLFRLLLRDLLCFIAKKKCRTDKERYY